MIVPNTKLIVECGQPTVRLIGVIAANKGSMVSGEMERFLQERGFNPAQPVRTKRRETTLLERVMNFSRKGPIYDVEINGERALVRVHVNQPELYEKVGSQIGNDLLEFFRENREGGLVDIQAAVDKKLLLDRRSAVLGVSEARDSMLRNTIARGRKMDRMVYDNGELYDLRSGARLIDAPPLF